MRGAMAGLFSTLSTEGNRRRSASLDIGLVPDEKWIEPDAPVFRILHQQIQTEARHVVGDDLQRRVLVLIHDLRPAAALVADFSLDHRIVAAVHLDRPIADALGGAAGEALDADLVPHGGAGRAARIASALGALDAYHH